MDVLESMSDAFFSVDRHWNILQVNARMEKISKRSREDLIGSNFREGFYNELQQQQTHSWKQFQKAMNDRVSQKFEDYYEPLEIWTENRIFPQPDGGLAVFFDDISENKRNQSRFSNIFDTIPIFAGYMNREGTMTFINQSAVEVISVQKSDVLGKAFWNCDWWKFLPDAQQRLKISLQQALLGISERYDTHYIAMIDGQPQLRWVDFSMMPIIGANSKIEDILVTGFDITERIEQAAELLSAKASAENANSTKSQFLANMSHEIRTPLGAILGFTDVLRNPHLNENERHHYLEIINRNGQALTKIIDDILDLSKIEAGKLEIEVSPLCLIELSQDIVSMFADRAAGKGIQLQLDTSQLPNFKINSDAARIRQVMVNLLGNAIKFTSQGCVKVYGHYESEGPHDKKIKIHLFVTDTGIGMSRAQAEKLFTPFTQGDNRSTRRFGGTGLGLALSKKLGEAMGGSVQLIDCQEGLGCTFQLTIRAQKSIVESPQQRPQQSESQTSASYRLRGYRILVVDDSADNRELIELFLKREGATIEQAESGEQSIQMALSNSYDAILMDIQMPGLDGYQALSLLRTENYQKPVLALTAHAMKEEKNRALSSGFADHISKPVNPQDLVQSLLTHLRGPY
jgi:PAS domain S-box-containing protein